jgi:hypothetical protein
MGKRPARIGVGVGANISLQNEFSSGVGNLNLDQMNNRTNSKYNARLFINF